MSFYNKMECTRKNTASPSHASASHRPHSHDVDNKAGPRFVGGRVPRQAGRNTDHGTLSIGLVLPQLLPSKDTAVRHQKTSLFIQPIFKIFAPFNSAPFSGRPVKISLESVERKSVKIATESGSVSITVAVQCNGVYVGECGVANGAREARLPVRAVIFRAD